MGGLILRGRHSMLAQTIEKKWLPSRRLLMLSSASCSLITLIFMFHLGFIYGRSNWSYLADLEKFEAVGLPVIFLFLAWMNLRRLLIGGYRGGELDQQ
jgi:TRAP-type C4-dicarboxylate transport system permease small subunit